MSYEQVTENLKLPQFVGTDNVDFEDFNTAFLNIDNFAGSGSGSTVPLVINFTDGTSQTYKVVVSNE